MRSPWGSLAIALVFWLNPKGALARRQFSDLEIPGMGIVCHRIGTAGSGRMASVPRLRGGDWLADDINALRDAGIYVLVNMLAAGESAE